MPTTTLGFCSIARARRYAWSRRSKADEHALSCLLRRAGSRPCPLRQDLRARAHLKLRIGKQQNLSAFRRDQKSVPREGARFHLAERIRHEESGLKCAFFRDPARQCKQIRPLL